MADQVVPPKGLKILPLAGVKKILLRGTNWIGDAVLTLPAISAIRSTYPQALICVLAKPWVADIYRLCPSVDEVIVYEHPGSHEGVTGLLRLAARLKCLEFDMAILLQNAIEAAIIARLAGIPVRAGYNTDVRGLLLTHAIKMTPGLKRFHQVDYYKYMVAALGCESPSSGPLLQLSAADDLAACRILDEQGLGQGSLFIGMAPGASYGPAKKWHPERFGAVAERLREESGIGTILFGSSGDREASRMVQDSCAYPLLDLAGKTGLRTAAAMIAKCRLFISNDSGLMHMAGAMDVPTVAIFGSTNPMTTSPVGKSNVIIYEEAECSPCLLENCPTDFKCMDSITSEKVYAIARGILCS